MGIANNTYGSNNMAAKVVHSRGRSNRRTKNQSMREQPLLVMHPTDSDILCGKDKACISHVGSRRFRCVIESYRKRYLQASTKQEKMKITKEIYDGFCQSSSRFLKWNETMSGWEELTPLVARDKVSHALRFANRGLKKKVPSSSTESNNNGNKKSTTKKSHRRSGSDTCSTSSESTCNSTNASSVPEISSETSPRVATRNNYVYGQHHGQHHRHHPLMAPVTPVTPMTPMSRPSYPNKMEGGKCYNNNNSNMHYPRMMTPPMPPMHTHTHAHHHTPPPPVISYSSNNFYHHRQSHNNQVGHHHHHHHHHHHQRHQKQSSIVDNDIDVISVENHDESAAYKFNSDDLEWIMNL